MDGENFHPADLMCLQRQANHTGLDCGINVSRTCVRVRDLDDSVLAALDGLAEPLCALSLQTLMKDLLKGVHGVVHLLLVKEKEQEVTLGASENPVGMGAREHFISIWIWYHLPP